MDNLFKLIVTNTNTNYNHHHTVMHSYLTAALTHQWAGPNPPCGVSNPPHSIDSSSHGIDFSLQCPQILPVAFYTSSVVLSSSSGSIVW